MSTVGTISVINLAGKASQILRRTPVLETDGIVYSGFLAEIANQSAEVANKLLGLGLRRGGGITPEAIQSLGEYGTVFTKHGTFIPERADDIFATVHEAKISPKEMTTWQYLVNTCVWRPKILNPFGIKSVQKAPDKVAIYERSYHGAEVEAPSEAFLAACAKVRQETIKGIRASIAGFKTKGEDTSMLEEHLGKMLSGEI